MEELIVQFGKNVQKRRKAIGISQERLSQLAGLQRTYDAVQLL